MNPKAVVVVRDLLGLLGVGAMSYGAWLIYEPAGYLVGGLILAGVAAIGAFRPTSRG